MAIIPKQIGWSQESNLLWNISSQLDRLTKVIANLSPGGGGTNIYNSDGTLTGHRTLNGANYNLIFSDLINFDTIYQGNNLGLNFDFQSKIFNIGDIFSLYNNLQVNIGDLSNNFGTIRILKQNNQWLNTIISISSANNYIGDINTVNNGIVFIVDDILQQIKTLGNTNGDNIGLKLDFANSIYQLGQITGANTTYLTIDDTAAYPVQLTGTSISSGTAGAASGQFLKIKVGGVDYKIALLNP